MLRHGPAHHGHRGAVVVVGFGRKNPLRGKAQLRHARLKAPRPLAVAIEFQTAHGGQDGGFPRDAFAHQLRGFPFQVGVAEGRFAKPLVKISKAVIRLLTDDCPTN